MSSNDNVKKKNVSTFTSKSDTKKIAQYKSFVQKEIGVKYRIPGSGIPFKS